MGSLRADAAAGVLRDWGKLCGDLLEAVGGRHCWGVMGDGKGGREVGRGFCGERVWSLELWDFGGEVLQECRGRGRVWTVAD